MRKVQWVPDMRTTFYTGKGDEGKSAMGQKKILKDVALFWALGSVDELNSWLGFIRVEAEEEFAEHKSVNEGRKAKKRKDKETLDIPEIIKELQQDLFIVQAELATVGMANLNSRWARRRYKDGPTIGEEKTERLERIIAHIDAVVPPIRKFVIPGGSQVSAGLDVARAVARRAEREVIVCDRTFGNRARGKKKTSLRPQLLQFLNRLSSVLFALARYANYVQRKSEEHPRYT